MSRRQGFDFMTRYLAMLFDCGMIVIAITYIAYQEIPRLIVCLALGALISHSIHSINKWWKN